MSSRPVTITDIEQLGEPTQDLLIERTLWGLEPSQETELSVAVSDVDSTAYEFERTVGALAVGMWARSEPESFPADLGARLRALGASTLSRPSGIAPSAGADESAASATGDGPIPFPTGGHDSAVPVGRAAKASPLQWMGWLAAAACLTYAIFVATPDARPRPGGAPDTSARLASLERDATDIVRANWAGMSAIGAPVHALDEGVSGEIIWSDERDEGFMKISGIRPNDPDEFQYQLWIFDAERRTGDLPQFRAEGLPEVLTQRPVDGGVFDVPAGSTGEVLVPVNAKLPVGKGVIFAVTKEPPGGVVVSDRDIVFLALRG
jgi:hypothetical protein